MIYDSDCKMEKREGKTLGPNGMVTMYFHKYVIAQIKFDTQAPFGKNADHDFETAQRLSGAMYKFIYGDIEERIQGILSQALKTQDMEEFVAQISTMDQWMRQQWTDGKHLPAETT